MSTILRQQLRASVAARLSQRDIEALSNLDIFKPLTGFEGPMGRADAARQTAERVSHLAEVLSDAAIRFAWSVLSLSDAQSREMRFIGDAFEDHIASTLRALADEIDEAR